MEVFPVEIALRGETIWLGWVSPEDGDSFFLTNNGRLIFSCDGKGGLMLEIMKASPDAQMDVESFFDFDSIIDKFNENIAVKDNFALDVWNLLIDLYYTFDSNGQIMESSTEVYRRLFSQSEAALMVDVQRVKLSTRDIEAVRKVLVEGIEFLTQKIDIAKKARSH